MKNLLTIVLKDKKGNGSSEFTFPLQNPAMLKALLKQIKKQTNKKIISYTLTKK